MLLTSPELLRQQFVRSGESFLWAVSQIPRGRSHVLPLPIFGEWPVARIVFQVVWYEREIALPCARRWVGDISLDEEVLSNARVEADWRASQYDIPQLIAEFHALREAVLAQLDSMDVSLWQQQRLTPWGEVTLAWLVAQVSYHMMQNTLQLIEMALYWDLTLKQQKQARRAQRNEQDESDRRQNRS